MTLILAKRQVSSDAAYEQKNKIKHNPIKELIHY